MKNSAEYNADKPITREDVLNRMKQEQNAFRDKITQHYPHEVLDYAREYVIREDILESMNFVDIPEDQLKLLLLVDRPLEQIARRFLNKTPDQINDARLCVEAFAKELTELQPEDGEDVLVIIPGLNPFVTQIDLSDSTKSLKALQGLVGGYIQTIYPFDDPVALVCDEEGKCKQKPYNRSLRDKTGTIYDIVAGTFVITGVDGPNLVALSPDLIEKYKAQFADTENELRFMQSMDIFM